MRQEIDVVRGVDLKVVGVCVVLTMTVCSGLSLSTQNGKAVGDFGFDDFWVYGDVTKSPYNPPQYAALTLLNERTNETLYGSADGGSYMENLANFSLGYLRGDMITIDVLDLNATGGSDWNVTAFVVPQIGNSLQMNVALIQTAMPDAMNPIEPPGGDGMLGLGDGPRSPGGGGLSLPPDQDPKNVPNQRRGGSSILGKQKCNWPPWGQPWIITDAQYCLHKDIPVSGLVQIQGTGSLTLEHSFLKLDPGTSGTGVEIWSGGALYVKAHDGGWSTVQRYEEIPPYYSFSNSGYLEVTGSIVEGMSTGVIVNSGGLAVFQKYSHLSYSYDSIIRNSGSSGLIAYSGSRVEMSDTDVYSNAVHGVYLETSYGHIRNSHIYANSQNGVEVRYTGATRSCYGQPDVNTAILAFWAWCDDQGWWIRYTSEPGGSHNWWWKIQTQNNPTGYEDSATSPGATYYQDSSLWATYTLKIDSLPATTNEIFFGLSGANPTANPFTISNGPLVKGSWIEGNQKSGIYAYQSAPTVTENLWTGASGGVSGNQEFGVTGFESSPAIQQNSIRNNVFGGVASIFSYTSDPSYYVALNTITAPSSPATYSYGIYVYAELPFSRIKDNDVSGYWCGICFDYGQYYIIEGNDVHDSLVFGIYAFGVHSAPSSIAGNDVYSNPIGIDIRFSPSVTAEGNTIRQNSEVGIRVRSRYSWSGTTIDKPVVRNNPVYANTNLAGTAIGIQVVDDWDDRGEQQGQGCVIGATPLIDGNDIHDNDFGIRSMNSGPRMTNNNDVHENTWGIMVNGYYLDGPPHCSLSTTKVEAGIAGNLVRLNEENGIQISNSAAVVDGNTVEQNKFGIVVKGGGSPPTTPEISSNGIHSNVQSGIHSSFAAPEILLNIIDSNDIGVYLYGLVPGYPGSVPIITDNTIADNLRYGINVKECSAEIVGTQVDAQLITGNGLGHGFWIGAGVYLQDASPHIALNTIEGKVVWEQIGWLYRLSVRQDYGIFAYGASSPLIEDNYVGHHRLIDILLHGTLTGGPAATIVRNQLINNWWIGPSYGIFAAINDHSTIGSQNAGNTICARYASIAVNQALPTFPVIQANDLSDNCYWDYIDIQTIFSSPTIGGAETWMGNDLGGARFGIWEYDHSSSIISNNEISAGWMIAWGISAGVRIDKSSSTTVGPENEILNCPYGIEISGDARPTILDNSQIHSNSVGIHVAPSAGVNTQIQGNTIVSSSQYGIFLEGTSIVVGPSNHFGTQLTGNNIGVYVNSGSPTIQGNHIEGNAQAGIYIYTGSPTIEGNSITDNIGDGLLSDYATPIIGGSGLDSNTFSANAGWAIHMRGDEATNSGTLLNDNDLSGNEPRKVWQQWWLTLHITHAGRPYQGASAYSYCVELGVYEIQGSTNANGDISGWVTEYQTRYSVREYYHQTIGASIPGHDPWQEIVQIGGNTWIPHDFP
jgi:parallel beta-helix repeat protein